MVAAGAHLAEIFGPRYAAIGTAVGVSEENGIGDLDDLTRWPFWAKWYTAGTGRSCLRMEQ